MPYRPPAKRFKKTDTNRLIASLSAAREGARQLTLVTEADLSEAARSQLATARGALALAGEALVECINATGGPLMVVATTEAEERVEAD